MKSNDFFPDNVSFLPEVRDDLAKLDGSVIAQIAKGIKKVAQNPLPKNEGGYGTPLSNNSYSHLAGYNKIKFRQIGIRCVYRCVKCDNNYGMRIIVISCRADEEVYIEANKRIKKYQLL